VHPDVSAALGGTGGSRYEPLGITFFGVATGLRRISALGCHLHERGRGWPPFAVVRFICYMLGWSGHHLQNSLSLARLKIAPRLCTQPSPRRWVARAGAGISFWGTSSLAWLQDCAVFHHVAATFMREVAAGHLVVVEQTTCNQS